MRVWSGLGRLLVGSDGRPLLNDGGLIGREGNRERECSSIVCGSDGRPLLNDGGLIGREGNRERECSSIVCVCGTGWGDCWSGLTEDPC